MTIDNRFLLGTRPALDLTLRRDGVGDGFKVLSKTCVTGRRDAV
jgi:hypothetical protein